MSQGDSGQLYSTFILPHDVSSQQDEQCYHCLKRQSVFITTLSFLLVYLYAMPVC